MISVKTVEEFNAILEANDKVVVDFFATWCGPCKTLKPHFAQWETEFSKLKFVTVDIDEAEDLAEQQGIEAMPTIMLFKKKETFKTIVGAETSGIQDALKKLEEASTD